MKNIVLFLILVLLCIFTFYYEEVGVIRSNIAKEKSKMLFNHKKLGAFSYVKTPSIYMRKNKKLFYEYKSGNLISIKSTEQFFDALSKLKVDKILDVKNKSNNERVKFFGKSNDHFIEFGFKKGIIKFNFGKKLSFSQSFYVEIIEDNNITWAIASDNSASPEIYSKESSHNNGYKYKRLLNVLSLDKDFFLDKHIVQENEFDIDRVVINSNRNREFEVYIDQLKTKPSVPSGISANAREIKKFVTTLFSMEAHSLIDDFNIEDLDNNVSKIDIFGTKNITLNLYGKYKGEEGRFVTLSSSKKLFVLNDEVITVFFKHLQDFWLKKINLNKLKDNYKNLYFTLENDSGQTVDLKLIQKEDQLNFIRIDKQNMDLIDGSSLEELFYLISSEAFMYRQLSNDFDSNNYKLKFRFKDFDFILSENKNDFIITNLKEKFQLIYKKKDFLNLSLNFSNDFRKL